MESQKNRNAGHSVLATLLFTIQEFLVDFLGSFLPGILFLVGTVFALAPPLNELINALCKVKVESLNEVVYSLLKVPQGTPNIISIMLFAATLSLSYVLGFLCYRQELKKLNTISFEKISKNQEDSIKKEYEKSKEKYGSGYNEFN